MDACRLQIPSFDSQKKVLCQDPFCSPPRMRAASTRSGERWLRHICTEGMLDTLTATPEQPDLARYAASDLQRGQNLLQPAPAGSRGKTQPRQLFPVKPSLELAGVNKHQVRTLLRKDLNKGLYFLSSTDKQKNNPKLFHSHYRTQFPVI